MIRDNELLSKVEKENIFIANHIKFLKQMKGQIPKNDALRRIFQLIVTGPQMSSGELFSDMTAMQTTTDFILGFIKDPSITSDQLNTIVNSLDMVTFSRFHGRVLNENIYCSCNRFENGFNLPVLLQVKQSVHLKYCVATVASHLFDVSISKRFQTKPFGKMLEMFPKNEFLKKLMFNKNNITVLLEENIKCFINILCMYGHIYYYVRISESEI